ncbi:MAG TPA: hypothetical protein VGD80_33860, partial [Kofleriaceae bacterium]
MDSDRGCGLIGYVDRRKTRATERRSTPRQIGTVRAQRMVYERNARFRTSAGRARRSTAMTELRQRLARIPDAAPREDVEAA